MRRFLVASGFVLFSGLFSCASPQKSAIDLSEFYDVIKHWRDQHPDAEENLLAAHNTPAIADNLLLYQRANGGWPTNKNPLVKLSPAQKQEVLKNKGLADSSLDNRNTYPQIRYLAHAWQRTGDLRYKQALLKGLRYLLDNQYANGGWAHSPPAREGYRSHITIADEVMPGVLTLLRDIARREYPFNFLGDELASEVKHAWQRGENLLLDLQVEIDGVRTIWAGQYDKNTLQPVDARSYELAGLQSWESVAVVRYLMAEENPNPEIIQAIEDAVAWLKKAKITGLEIKKVETEPVRFRYHSSRYDLLVVENKNAPPIWARFYDLQTQEPFFANRDGSKVLRLQEVQRERRTGYDWYGDWPQALLEEEYPAWRARLFGS